MKHTINKNSLFIPTFPAIDKQQVARRFARAVTTYSEEATIQRQIAEKMLRLLQE